MSNRRERILQGSMQPEKNRQATMEQDTYGKNWLDSPWVKGTGIFIISLAALWASGFFFSALGFSIKSFKGMVKKVKETG
jgi:hypothetical protein